MRERIRNNQRRYRSRQRERLREAEDRVAQLTALLQASRLEQACLSLVPSFPARPEGGRLVPVLMQKSCPGISQQSAPTDVRFDDTVALVEKAIAGILDIWHFRFSVKSVKKMKGPQLTGRLA